MCTLSSRTADARRADAASLASKPPMATFMQQAAFRPLQLPSSIAVPVGAIDHSSDTNGHCNTYIHTLGSLDAPSEREAPAGPFLTFG